MKLTDFDYALPEELIAQTPIENRAASRMMVLNKIGGEIKHAMFAELPDFLNAGDCLVVNNTRVMPARLLTQADKTPVEVLLLNNIRDNIWDSLVKPGKKARMGDRLVFGPELTGVVEEITKEGNRLIRMEYEGIFTEILERLGQVPLPPYITEKLEDKERYQTVYSKELGSAAAPTAGLHFTDEILGKIREKGCSIAEITLHVGLGTFRPVKAENISEHHMHEEFYNIESSQAALINNAKKSGGRVIAIGTTSLRTLEAAAENGQIPAGSGWTDIFITPGYKFKMTDALFTNFHLPKSTLIMLVSAVAGRENVLRAYEAAVRERYRFFSFGDCMVIM